MNLLAASPGAISAIAIPVPTAGVLPPVRPRGVLGRAADWVNTPHGGLALLIVTTLLARLLFADALGLGIDESYMVAAGRTLRLGYFDHPPLAWWLAWGGGHLGFGDGPLMVRLPFVLLFALSTGLMYRLSNLLFGTCAGIWAAALFNAAPVFGLTTGCWVLPDGPLIAALLGAAVCLAEALRAEERAGWGWWLGAGACAGLALFSKYTAVLSLLGVLVYMLTQPAARRWLRRPQPYGAALVALAIFAPVVLWNGAHGWASLLFQAGRAGGGRWHVFGPLSVLGGEALFLLPWIWLPLIMCGWVALKHGPRDPAGWLMVCLAAPPIVLFLGVALRSHVLFHWAAPGYLMLFPLLGAAVGRQKHKSAAVLAWMIGTAALVVSGAVLVGTEVRFNWLPGMGEHFALGSDPDVEAVDWTALPPALAARGLLNQPGLVLGATRWHDAGKIDYALGGAAPVICLGDDPREYGLIRPKDAYFGQDVLIVAPRITLAEIRYGYGAQFDRIEQVAPVMIRHGGKPALLLPLFIGHRLHAGAMP